jgi:hypothetical protein
MRFLLPSGQDFMVQNAIRIGEVLLFDFDFLEDWLEAMLLADDGSLQRIAGLLAIAKPLSLERVPEDWPRVEHLIRSRIG